jgi:membrane fusion protein, multidrug efflux system
VRDGGMRARGAGHRAARRGWLAVAAVLAGLTGGCGGDAGDAGGGADEGTDTEAAAAGGGSVSLPVVGTPVREGDLVLSIVTTGQVRSDAIAMLKSETSGPVLRVHVRPGAAVRRGQVLVEVDPATLDLAVREAEAALADAELKVLDFTVPDSIVNGRPVTGERLRAAEVRAGLDRARAQLARARLERAKAAVTAPFDGVMDDVRVAVGDRLVNGQEIGRVVDVANLRVEAAVLEHDLPLVRVGGEATVTAAALPDRPLAGRVTAILPLVDTTTRAGRAVISLRGGGVLRPGMYADVRLEATRLAGRIVVPAPAIIERDGRPLVFVVKDDRAQWVYVLPGRSNGTETEILPDSATGQVPLVPGDVVLVEGHLTLTHDAPVRLVARQERGN